MTSAQIYVDGVPHVIYIQEDGQPGTAPAKTAIPAVGDGLLLALLPIYREWKDKQPEKLFIDIMTRTLNGMTKLLPPYELMPFDGTLRAGVEYIYVIGSGVIKIYKPNPEVLEDLTLDGCTLDQTVKL